ncbi:NADP-dependent oxidoreductase [Actinoplanes derwentensis]|uniref:NADPH:quinone reductase n=1 Tax=Actinoplanes derwentensis TaxID=113562 RepID=A0A1H1UQP5_9ACTN|nr:NADP-dependent oxidoreductase [Actinoplanes derwentensis]GID88140.1 NADPH:quinone reductase [Actinoplanes derwentensis]SDS74884.1 NADPH:quinone reductase [Actinoplanes derwentensis]
MMKAIQFHEAGGPDVLRYDEVPVPAIGPGEVLVRVHAVGINPPDWYLREGMTVMPPEMRPALEFPLTPGTDMSGVVEAVAVDVPEFAVGDEVFGMLRFPGFDGRAYAEYVAAPAADLARKPAGVDHVQAAGAPMAVLTAWQYLIDLGHDVPSPFTGQVHRPVLITPGMTVLVNGAAGGVGHFAVQLAKWKGARVIAVASGRHERFLRELGADEFIDYTTTDAADVARDVDLVIDAVGGPGAQRFLNVLKSGGTILPVFFAEYDPQETARRDITVSNIQVRSNGPQLAEIGRLFDSGLLQVGVDSTYPLSEAAGAHARAAQGHIQGKIVLTVRP